MSALSTSRLEINLYHEYKARIQVTHNKQILRFTENYMEASTKMCLETYHLNKKQYIKVITVRKNAELSTVTYVRNSNISSCSLYLEGRLWHCGGALPTPEEL